jgi:alpha-L-arabinofuranosidase
LLISFKLQPLDFPEATEWSGICQQCCQGETYVSTYVTSTQVKQSLQVVTSTQVKPRAQVMELVQVMHKLCKCVQMLNMAEWLNVLNILTSNLTELAEHV